MAHVIWDMRYRLAERWYFIERMHNCNVCCTYVLRTGHWCILSTLYSAHLHSQSVVNVKNIAMHRHRFTHISTLALKIKCVVRCVCDCGVPTANVVRQAAAAQLELQTPFPSMVRIFSSFFFFLFALLFLMCNVHMSSGHTFVLRLTFLYPLCCDCHWACILIAEILSFHYGLPVL